MIAGGKDVIEPIGETMKKTMLAVCLSALMVTCNVAAMTRTLKKDPAIVIAAFGTTTKASATYDFIEKQLISTSSLKKYTINWAFTSEIVRERANNAFAKKGLETRYLSLAQVLANLESEGYRKIVVQPLHIFPGQEYLETEKVVNAFRTLGLRIEFGDTLLHKWEYMFESVEALEEELLQVNQGCNILVAHGTPKTSPGSNATYLGLDRYLSQKYKNVFVGTVDGVLTREQALNKAKTCDPKQVKFIPFMLVAGDHIMNDIMGKESDDEGVLSWSMEMKKAGFSVDSLYTDYDGKKLYKGLGFNKKIVEIFSHQIEKSLERLEAY